MIFGQKVVISLQKSSEEFPYYKNRAFSEKVERRCQLGLLGCDNSYKNAALYDGYFYEKSHLKQLLLF